MKVYCVAYLGFDSEAALYLESSLERAGLKFTSATPDIQGIRKVAEAKPDIIIWDTGGASGADVNIPVEEFRKAGLENQPVIALVEGGDSEGAIQSLASGAVDFMYKPLKEEPLPRIIAALNTGQKQNRARWYARVIDQTNDQIKAILAAMEDPAYIVSPQFQILHMNRAAEEIFGEGLRGGTCHHVFYDRTEPCEICAKTKGPARWRAVLKNGKSYRFVSAITRNSKGEIEKLVVGTDITPDEEVKKIHRTFISNVSHDLRTPLAAIDQYVSIMLDGLGGEISEQQKEYLGVIKRSSFRLHNLIENLIDANNILSGHLKLTTEVTNVKDIVEIILPRIKAQAENSGLSFQVTIPDDLPNVYADKARIAQVVANLAGNAIKFTEQGMIQLRAGFMPRDEGRIIVSVEDTGIGIPKEDLANIFELFYRVEKDKVYVEEGAGLGLSISREIVRAHGGTLWVESMEGMGSAFHFTLPVHKGDAVIR
ncbi:MAG: ATP-binding protein [Actinomycetota bacterium]|nr:ATP-binding protein [Actinomycetota bacterium]